MASKEKIVITDGNYTFEETGEMNKFHFSRNDGRDVERLKKDIPLTFFARYLLCKLDDGEVQDGYRASLSYKRVDKGIEILVDDNQEEPKLRIVRV